MLYRVTKQYARGSGDTLVAQFKDANDAKLFIQARLLEDARLKVKVIYRLMEGMDLIEEFTEAQGEESGSSSGAGAQQRTSFQPTPFNATPRPSGMPSNWLKDEDEDKDEEFRPPPLTTPEVHPPAFHACARAWHR